MRNRWFIVPAAIVAIPLFVFIGGEIVLHLWNWLLPSLFGWRVITFWQALGLLVLCRVLFGGWGHRGFSRSNFRRRLHERWEGMTPEQRERFRQAAATRCGFAPSNPESQGQ
ncbi:MAG TPA: hypothetical protein VE545_06820 [Candidatus Dormibacteraeota bacterium]|nr:hypothetical protein [Candidatus Dormibacteraeota bacterium]